jgi:NADP-dependent alcohol dehydrogenase
MFETKKRETSAVRKTHFNLTGTDDEIANAAIDKTVALHMGMETKLSDYTADYSKQLILS